MAGSVLSPSVYQVIGVNLMLTFQHFIYKRSEPSTIEVNINININI